MKKWILISEALLNEAPPPMNFGSVVQTGTREIAKDVMGTVIPGLGATVDIISQLKRVVNNKKAMERLVAQFMRIPDNQRPPGKNAIDLDDRLSSIIDERFFMNLVQEITAKIAPYIYNNQPIPENFANTIAKQRIMKLLAGIPG